jgi:hypothetical protein
MERDMKQWMCLLLLTSALGCLWAEKPRRYVEFGFNLETGFANNYLGYKDFFNEDHVIDLNLTKMGVYDFNFAWDISSHTFFTISGSEFSVGLFAGVEGLIYGTISKGLFNLLSQGNSSSFSQAELAFGGGLFADVGIKAEKQLGKLRLLVSPGIFLPLVYIPKPVITFTVRTKEDDMSIAGQLAMDIYSPIALGKDGEFSLDLANLSSVTDSGALGLDVSVGTEYALSSILDAGVLISHIPLSASRLSYRARVKGLFEFNPESAEAEGSLLDRLQAGEIDSLITIEDPELTYSRGITFVSRPLRFDLYALFRPFSTQFLVLRPNAGISLFTLYGSSPCFNLGLEGQINLWRLFSVSLGTGYTELIWKHWLGINLNLRFVELNLGLSLRSQEFTESFKLNGLGLSLGLHIGF